MDQLQHEPHTKQNIKDALYAFLYDPVIKHFKTRIDDIIIRNSLMADNPHKSFVYKGVVYDCDMHQPPLKKNRLQPHLKPAMDEYLADLKELNDNELPHVLGYINQVLNSSNDLPDYLRLLPDALHHPIGMLIATCPCRAHQLPEEKVQQMRAKNQMSIQLIKQRMVTNLII